MSDPQWETVEVPRGAFVAWGPTPGVQEFVGAVIDYAPQGGTDFDGNPCPRVSLQLRAPAFSVNKQGQRTDHQIGDLVVMNAGLVSLKRAVQAMQIKPGDLVKIAFARLVPVAGGEVKEFDVQIARGAAVGALAPQSQSQPQPQPQAQQPYTHPPQGYPQPVPAGQGWAQPQQSQPPF